MKKMRTNTRRILIGFVGWAVLLVGVVMIPFPGPGWVVVFIGFSILATEFDWAKAAQTRLHEFYENWRQWFESQPVYIRLIFSLLTFMTAVIIVWLVNGYGILNSWVHLNQPWLVSPFFR